MITALYVPTGETIAIDQSLPRDWLQSESQANEFKCRSCSYIVNARLGDQKVWHFAHAKGSPAKCPLKWSTPEEDRIKLALKGMLEQRDLKQIYFEYFPRAFSSKWPVDILIQDPNEKWHAYQIVTKNSKTDKIRDTLPAKKRSNLNYIVSSEYHRPFYNDWMRLAPRVINVIENSGTNHLCFIDIEEQVVIIYNNVRSHGINKTWFIGIKTIIPIDKIQINPRTGLFGSLGANEG